MKIYINQLYSLLILFFTLSCNTSNNQSYTENKASQAESNNKNEKNTIVVSKDQFKGENMDLIHAEQQSFPTMIKTTGIIDVPPNSKAVISAFIGGYIKNSPLLIGDKVRKGQSLVSIENIDFVQLQQDYLEISEHLIYVKSEYERQKELFEEQISSKKSFLKAESDFKKTNAKYAGLRKKLEMLNINSNEIEQGNLTSVSTIYSPINGSITDVNVSTGTYVSPADKIMEIVNTEHIHLELKIFEKDALKIKKGQKVFFRIPESSGETFEGDIHLIGKSIGEDRTIQVHAHIDHGIKNDFIVGMFVETEIVIQDTVSIALPESALIRSGDRNSVLILKSKDNEGFTFINKEVKIGATYNNYVQILDANQFKDSDLILTGGSNLISDM